MSLSPEPEVLVIGLVDTPGSLSSNLARGGPKSGYKHMVYWTRADSWDDGKEDDESEDETDPPPPGQG